MEPRTGPRLTLTEILSAASETLERAGYQRVGDAHLRAWPANSRAFEDAYGVVGVAVYETWSALNSGWPDAQAALVELISHSLRRGEPKAWDGYLVLLTSALPDSEMQERASTIRYDTTRVRKLVSTGVDLREISDVERALLPLLPVVSQVSASVEQSALNLLPALLAEQRIDQGATAALVDAFLKQESVMERLHAFRLRS